MVDVLSYDASARRQATARLEEMDFCKMMDTKGDGLIHSVVLARTLHIFDQNVFTTPVVQEILDSLARDVPVRADGKIPLQSFKYHLEQTTRLSTARSMESGQGVRLSTARSIESGQGSVGQGSFRSAKSMDQGSVGQSGERTPTMAEEFGNSIDAYTDSLVCDIRGFNEVVKPEALVDAAGTSPEEIAELRAMLKAHAKKYVIDAQLRLICPLWEQFDRNGSGTLEPNDCTGLVAAYLHAMARKASEIIRGSIELGIELSLIISEKTVMDEGVRQQMRQHARLQVEAIHANVAPLVQQMLDKMADEDPHTIAGELLATLDFDGSGVTRNEFEQRFVESMQYVLGPEGLMDKLQRVNSLK